MSLHQIKTVKGVEVGARYRSICKKWDWIFVGSSDNKQGRGNRVYRFSEFDMECNFFQNARYTRSLTGDIRLRVRHKKRYKIFQTSRSTYSKVDIQEHML